MGIGHDKGTEDRTHDEAQIGEHGPKADYPDSLAGIEGVFNAAHYDSSGDGGQKPAETSAHRYSYQ